MKVLVCVLIYHCFFSIHYGVHNSKPQSIKSNQTQIELWYDIVLFPPNKHNKYLQTYKTKSTHLVIEIAVWSLYKMECGVRLVSIIQFIEKGLQTASIPAHSYLNSQAVFQSYAQSHRISHNLLLQAYSQLSPTHIQISHRHNKIYEQ